MLSKDEKNIKKLIKKSDNVFITGHRNLDLDAIGSCVGFSAICNHFNKKNYIIVDDKVHEIGVAKILDEIKDTNKIISSEDINKYFKDNSLLIITDVSKAHLLQNDKILHYFKEIIVVDHHQITDQTIESTIRIIDTNRSSAGEIVTSLIKAYNIPLTTQESTIILSGIILDTNNFTVKTNSDTYLSAYYLTKMGANPKKVQYYLKEDLKDYIIRHKVIMNVTVINDKYAVCIADTKDEYKREDLAKIADTLLNFNNILASFVVGKRQDGGIGISSRSEGIVNVGELLEKLGGGGDVYNAACQIKDMNIDDVKEALIKILKED